MDYINKRRKIIIFAAAIMALTMVPYIVGYATQGEEWRYTGFVIALEDGNSYIAKMLSGASGKWLFRSPHSAVEQNGVVAYLPYLLLGKLAGGSARHDQLVVIYHLARFLFGGFAIIATYDFVAVFIKNENLRWWALTLITLGGGLGWILVAASQKDFLGSLPLEFISPESFGFLGIFGFPHLAAARAFLLWGLTIFIKKDHGYMAGVFWLIAGFFQPMVVVIAWAVVGTYSAASFLSSFIERDPIALSSRYGIKVINKTLQSVLVSAPIVIYTGYIFLFDPYFRAWTEQNRFLSPHFVHYLFAYGLVLPFAVFGIRKLIAQKKPESILLAGWIIISPILIYAPVITQRRLAEGIWAVLIIGMVGNFSDTGKIPTPVRLLTFALFPSTVFIFFGSILAVLNPAEPIFRKVAEVTAYQFISENADVDKVVLSSFSTGNNLPAWAPLRVVMGHGPETIGLAEIQAGVEAYFNVDGNDWECQDISVKFNADYLYWGPAEKQTWEIDPEKLTCLVRIYNAGDYSIYKVNTLD